MVVKNQLHRIVCLLVPRLYTKKTIGKVNMFNYFLISHNINEYVIFFPVRRKGSMNNRHILIALTNIVSAVFTVSEYPRVPCDATLLAQCPLIYCRSVPKYSVQLEVLCLVCFFSEVCSAKWKQR